MTDAIIVALISACASIVAQLLINAQNRKEMSIAQAVRDKGFEDRLQVIEEKLESHNSYAEKFASVSNSIVAMQKDIEYLRKEK